MNPRTTQMASGYIRVYILLYIYIYFCQVDPERKTTENHILLTFYVIIV